MDQSQHDNEPLMKEPRAYSEDELLAEIFQSIPEKGLNEMFNLINGIAYNIAEGTAQRMIELCPERRREIDIAFEKIERITERKIDELFNTLQEYLAQEIWKIPERLDIQLEQHQGIDFNVSSQDEENIDIELADLRNKIIAQKKLNAVLTVTYEKKQLVNQRINKILQSLKFLDEIPQQMEVQDVSSILKMIKDQVDELQKATLEHLGSDEISLVERERSDFLRARIEMQLKCRLNQ